MGMRRAGHEEGGRVRIPKRGVCVRGHAPVNRIRGPLPSSLWDGPVAWAGSEAGEGESSCSVAGG